MALFEDLGKSGIFDLDDRSESQLGAFNTERSNISQDVSGDFFFDRQNIDSKSACPCGQPRWSPTRRGAAPQNPHSKGRALLYTLQGVRLRMGQTAQGVKGSRGGVI